MLTEKEACKSSVHACTSLIDTVASLEAALVAGPGPFKRYRLLLQDPQSQTETRLRPSGPTASAMGGRLAT